MTGESEILQAPPAPVNMVERRSFVPLTVVAVAGVLLRLAYAWLHASQKLFATWQDPDPDRYVAAASRLVAGGQWHWSFDAVAYAAFVKAPLYPVFLSLVSLAPGFPRTAILLHAAIGVGTIVGVFCIGRALHSTRAGTIAAAIQAFWLPSIVSSPAFYQEHLAVPLTTLGLGLLLDGRGRGWRWNASAAITLTAAMLARAMPLYLIAVTAIAAPWVFRERGDRRRVLAAIAAAVLLTLPYSWSVSRARHEPIAIENIGFIHLAFNDPPGRPIAPPSGTPVRASRAIEILAAQAAADPLWMARTMAARTRDVMRPLSTWWLPLMTITASQGAGACLKAVTHVWADVPLILVWLLAPFGIIAARERRLGMLVAVWIVAAILLTTVTGLTGARFRAVVDPLAIVLTACVLARSGHRASPAAIAVAAAVAIAIASAFASFTRDIVHARSDVAVRPWIVAADGSRSTRLHGYGAFTAMGDERPISLRVRCGAAGERVEIRADDRLLAIVEPRQCASGYVVDIPLPPRMLMRVEIVAPGADIDVTLWDRRVETAIMASAARRTRRLA